MESFGSKNRSPESWRTSLGVLALVAAMAPAEALSKEIPEINGKNWNEGVSVLRSSVEQSKHEVGSIFMKSSGPDAGEWHSKGKAEKIDGGMSVVTKSGDVYELVKSYEEKQGSIEIVCNIHTHPLSVVPGISPVEVEKLLADNKFYLAPSVGDHEFAHNKSYHDEVGYETTNAIFTPGGVWYYRIATPDDYKDFPVADKLNTVRLEASAKLFGDDASSGLLSEVISGLDQEKLSLLKELASTSTESLEDLVLDIKNKLELVSSFDDPLLEQLIDTFPELTGMLNSFVKMKVFGRKLFSYSDFYAMYGNLPSRYDSIATDMVGQEINGFRENISVYDNYKSSATGGISVPLDSNMVYNLSEDMLIDGNVKSRYVTYDELKSEPPCAGPDYKRNDQ